MQVSFASFHMIPKTSFKMSTCFHHELALLLSSLLEKSEAYNELNLCLTCHPFEKELKVQKVVRRKHKISVEAHLSLEGIFEAEHLKVLGEFEKPEIDFRVKKRSMLSYNSELYVEQVLSLIKELDIDLRDLEKSKALIDTFLNKVKSNDLKYRPKHSDETFLESLWSDLNEKPENLDDEQKEDLVFYKNTWVRLVKKMKFTKDGYLII